MRGLNDKQIFDDFARLATGAVGAFSGFRQHLKDEIKTHLDRFLIELDLVPRSDFEIVEQMAKQARLDNDSLKKRVAALEAQLSAKTTASKTSAAKPIVKKKPAAKAAVKKTTPGRRKA